MMNVSTLNPFTKIHVGKSVKMQKNDACSVNLVTSSFRAPEVLCDAKHTSN